MNLLTIRKHQRLTLRSEIDALFSEGKWIYSGALRITYRFVAKTGKDNIKFLVTVPKRRFRKATERNRIKRLIREAFRLNYRKIMQEIPNSDVCIHAGFIYSGSKSDVTLGEMEIWVLDALTRLATEAGKIRS